MGMFFSNNAKNASGNNMVRQLVEIFNKVANSKDEKEIAQLLQDAKNVCTIPDTIKMKAAVTDQLEQLSKILKKAETDVTMLPSQVVEHQKKSIGPSK